MNRSLVREKELTGKTSLVCLIDGTVRKLPEAQIRVKTLHLSGKVKAPCMDTTPYDFIIGNVAGAKFPITGSAALTVY